MLYVALKGAAMMEQECWSTDDGEGGDGSGQLQDRMALSPLPTLGRHQRGLGLRTVLRGLRGGTMTDDKPIPDLEPLTKCAYT